MKVIVGIDEVGRGPIAGPVAVCSFLCEPSFFPITEIDLPMRDSKKLSKIQREKWFEYLKAQKAKGNCDFAVSYVSAEMIDKFGIVKAIQKSLDYSLEKVAEKTYQNFRALPSLRGLRHDENFEKFSPQLGSVHIFLDGGLKAPKEYINQETIIKGDELHPVISCASIIAKVSRDKIMANYAKEYPEYGFEKHSGYGTKAHYEAIKNHGVTPLHRKTFLKSIV
jgi:ribonuclease HII